MIESMLNGFVYRLTDYGQVQADVLLSESVHQSLSLSLGFGIEGPEDKDGGEWVSSDGRRIWSLCYMKYVDDPHCPLHRWLVSVEAQTVSMPSIQERVCADCEYDCAMCPLYDGDTL